MGKNSTAAFQAALKKCTDLITNAQSYEEIDLSDVELRILSKYVGEAIYFSRYLLSKKLVIKKTNNFDFEINFSSTDQKRTSNKYEFHLFIMQSSLGFYLVVKSSFNLYDHLSREPSQEIRGEYRFQNKLAQILGLKNAHAYETTETAVISEQSALKKDLELMYCGNKDISLLLYSI